MKARVAAPLLVLLLLLAACGASSQGAERRTLTVFAAASLTEVFTDLARRFEADNPGVDVVMNFAGSSELVQQILNGARADVFAAASDATMRLVTDAGLVAGSPTVFATNTLQIAVAPGNPREVHGFADLSRPGLTVVTCAPQVPCGAAVERVEQATGVTVKPVSEELDVRSTLGRVTTGNADAGLVYGTDVRAAGGAVEGVSFPEAMAAVTNYPIAVLAGTPEPELAARFRDLVTGETGRAALSAAGFGVP